MPHGGSGYFRLGLGRPSSGGSNERPLVTDETGAIAAPVSQTIENEASRKLA